MKVWMIDEFIFVKDRVFILKHGRIYEIPENWASLIVSQGNGAEYIRIAEDFT